MSTQPQPQPQQQNVQKEVTSGRVFSSQGDLTQVPQVDSGIKKCGYCDMLVRWAVIEGKNVASNADGSRHQCRINGTAKRDVPVKHDRPTATEIVAFLKAGEKRERESSAAGPVTGAGGNSTTAAAGGTAATTSAAPAATATTQPTYLPNHPQQQQPQPPATSAPATITTTSNSQADRDAAIKAMHEANIAAWKAQAEATDRLADAMVQVARSVDALAKASSDAVTSDYRLADEIARLTHLLRGIVAAAVPPAGKKGSEAVGGATA